jgi:hypothetical protein
MDHGNKEETNSGSPAQNKDSRKQVCSFTQGNKPDLLEKDETGELLRIARSCHQLELGNDKPFFEEEIRKSVTRQSVRDLRESASVLLT